MATPPPRSSRSDLTRRRPLLVAPLVVAALLVASVGVLSAPAAAQTAVWSATLTVQDVGGGRYGCDNSSSQEACTGALTVDDFTFDGATYTITSIILRRGQIFLTMDPEIADAMSEWSLQIGSASLPFEDNSSLSAHLGQIRWDAPDGFDLVENEQVAVSLLAPGGGGGRAFGVVPHVVVPLAPEAPMLEPGPGTLDVSWVPPAARAGGVLAACWVLRYSEDGGHTWTTVRHYSTTPSATLERLTPGRRYLVRVAGLLGGLTGFWSPPTEATTAALAPTPPEAPTAPIDPPDGSAATTDPPEDAAATPDPPQEVDEPTTPDAPGTPGDLTLSAGAGSLTVTWEPPDDTGGAPLLGYAVEYGIGGVGHHRWPRPDALTVDTTVTIVGLTGGRPHWVRVGAVGCAGVSHWTLPAVATPTVEPPAAPAAPDAPTLRPGPGQLTVTWRTPRDGGTPVDGYLIEYSTDGSHTWTTRPHTATTTTATLDGLPGGIAHQVRVRATNAAGTGSPSPAATAVPTSAPPDRPATPTVTPGAQRLTVTWTPPHPNGAPIDSYTVEYSTDRGRTWTTWPHIGTATTATITGLAGGHRHQIRITATNAAGAGPPSPTRMATPH